VLLGKDASLSCHTLSWQPWLRAFSGTGCFLMPPFVPSCHYTCTHTRSP
jgi:hypothetical protein